MLPISFITQFFNSGFILSGGKDEIWLGWGDATRLAEPSRNCFFAYAPDFFLRDKTPWWGFPHYQKVTYSELVQALTEYCNNPAHKPEGYDLSSMEWTKPDFKFFRDTFLFLKEQFHLRVLEKAVPVVFEKSNYKVGSYVKADWLLRLITYSRELPVQVYGIWNEEEGILGATPEVLLQQGNDGVLHTIALAGTRLKADSELPILHDEKELEEHQIVVDGIRSSLRNFGRIELGETNELSLPHLSHLLTPIALHPHPTFKLTQENHFFEEIVKQLHPTPALGAVPRLQGMQWLETYEKQIQRYRFGAPFGARWESGETRCVVSIRNLQWNPSEVLLGGGCGIIPKSQLNREWREIQGKIQAVKMMFGLAEDQVKAYR